MVSSKLILSLAAAVSGALALVADDDFALRLIARQAPGTPEYNCHDNCGKSSGLYADRVLTETRPGNPPSARVDVRLQGRDLLGRLQGVPAMRGPRQQQHLVILRQLVDPGRPGLRPVDHASGWQAGRRRACGSGRRCHHGVQHQVVDHGCAAGVDSCPEHRFDHDCLGRIIGFGRHADSDHCEDDHG